MTKPISFKRDGRRVLLKKSGRWGASHQLGGFGGQQDE
jgi:hypothetical protein